MSNYKEDFDERLDSHHLEIPHTAQCGCSIEYSASRALRACKTSQQNLRVLRENLFHCPTCPDAAGCELYEYFSMLIDQAVAGIIEEWGW